MEGKRSVAPAPAATTRRRAICRHRWGDRPGEGEAVHLSGGSGPAMRRHGADGCASWAASVPGPGPDDWAGVAVPVSDGPEPRGSLSLRLGQAGPGEVPRMRRAGGSWGSGGRGSAVRRPGLSPPRRRWAAGGVSPTVQAGAAEHRAPAGGPGGVLRGGFRHGPLSCTRGRGFRRAGCQRGGEQLMITDIRGVGRRRGLVGAEVPWARVRGGWGGTPLPEVRCVLQCVAVFAGLANEDWHYINLAVIRQRRISSSRHSRDAHLAIRGMLISPSEGCSSRHSRGTDSALPNQVQCGIALDLMDELADIRCFCMHYSTVALGKVTSLGVVERSGCQDS